MGKLYFLLFQDQMNGTYDEALQTREEIFRFFFSANPSVR